MYLFFDTETTGIPRDYKAPATDLDNWPRMVQVAWAKYDHAGNLIDEFCSVIKPEGFVIPPQASAVHGIDTERAIQEGKDLAYVLGSFAEEVGKSLFLVAHNMAFDEKIIGAELIRKKINHKLDFIPKLCTMQASIEFCALPGNYGYKYPRLDELHNCLFGKGFDDAHDALVDVRACARCFFELKNRGIMKL